MRHSFRLPRSRFRRRSASSPRTLQSNKTKPPLPFWQSPTRDLPNSSSALLANLASWRVHFEIRQNEPKPRHPVAPESHLFGEPSTHQNEPKLYPNPPSRPVRPQPATHCYTPATASPNPDTPPHPRRSSGFDLPLEPASPRKISPFYGSSRFWHSS